MVSIHPARLAPRRALDQRWIGARLAVKRCSVCGGSALGWRLAGHSTSGGTALDQRWNRTWSAVEQLDRP
ncbi:hypothetical protein [Gordonia sp. CPCC 205333]|uniref:hypothetical protein n=1 Tax=Gordonia sp. CPCC 205333 TaxID=3140790 RepID=UPI003AF33979